MCIRARHMGIKEQLIFPELVYDKIDKIRGMDIMFTTTAVSYTHLISAKAPRAR